MTIGDRIKGKRKSQGLSQETLGDMLNVSRQTVYKWETNQSVPELDKLLRIAELFDVSIGWLTTGEEAKTDNTITGRVGQLNQFPVAQNIMEHFHKKGAHYFYYRAVINFLGCIIGIIFCGIFLSAISINLGPLNSLPIQAFILPCFAVLLSVVSLFRGFFWIAIGRKLKKYSQQGFNANVAQDDK